MPKIKVLCRNPDDYLRETKDDIHKGKILLITAACSKYTGKMRFEK
jgi:hypothetical protein